jgi:hypothetical protein
MLHREYLQAGESLSSLSGSYIVQVSGAEAQRASLWQKLYTLQLQMQVCPAEDATKRADLERQIEQLKRELDEEV